MIKPRNACSSSAPSNGGDSKQEGCPIGKYIPIDQRLRLKGLPLKLAEPTEFKCGKQRIDCNTPCPCPLWKAGPEGKNKTSSGYIE